MRTDKQHTTEHLDCDVEQILRVAADYAPQSQMPDGLVARALHRRARPGARRISAPLGIAAAAVAAVLLIPISGVFRRGGTQTGPKTASGKQVGANTRSASVASKSAIDKSAGAIIAGAGSASRIASAAAIGANAEARQPPAMSRATAKPRRTTARSLSSART